MVKAALYALLIIIRIISLFLPLLRS